MTKCLLIDRADVVTMIKDWQSECADHPALHNQGNVLLDRLAAIAATPALATVSAKIKNALQSLQMAEEGEFGRGYAEALAFALDAIDEVAKWTEIPEDVIDRVARAIHDSQWCESYDSLSKDGIERALARQTAEAAIAAYHSPSPGDLK